MRSVESRVSWYQSTQRKLFAYNVKIKLLSDNEDKNSHGSHCGAAFDEIQEWPRLCSICGNTSYINPLPVAVLLLPVNDGLFLIRREIEPNKGMLALPGGFINFA